MENKKKYIKPTLIVSNFSIKDVIHTSGPVPCPSGDTCPDENAMSIDDQILNGTIK